MAKARKRAAPSTEEQQTTTTVPGRYVAEYADENKVSGNRLVVVSGADLSEARGRAEGHAPKGFYLFAIFAQCWPNAPVDADGDEDEEEGETEE